MSSTHRTTPASIFMALAGDSSPLRLLGLTVWVLSLAFVAGCVVALLGLCASLRAGRDGTLGGLAGPRPGRRRLSP